MLGKIDFKSGLIAVSLFLGTTLFVSCSNDSLERGTYGYDLEFLKSHDSSVIELVANGGESRVVVSPKYQAKVFSSSSSGLSGDSYGWINYDELNQSEFSNHINAYGGEERFWLAPEGGQYSLFFKPGDEMIFDNWQTPAPLDTEPWSVVSSGRTAAVLSKEIKLSNYQGSEFHAEITRELKVLTDKDVNSELDIAIPSTMRWVGYRSSNRLTNIGDNEWTEEGGTLSIWLLSMFKPSESGVVFIPYSSDVKSDEIVRSNYFGAVPDSRLKVDEKLIWFKVDGKERGKIGVGYDRSTPFIGSYSSEDRVLTVLVYNRPTEKRPYMAQLWEIQEEPYNGDAINAYNDGPLEDGSQMGPFYEMESASPAALLKPEESIEHIQSIFHFTGSEDELTLISNKLFGVTIDDITNQF